jgi:phosphoglycolate phosphatase-like HAD superfamily hydrolase
MSRTSHRLLIFDIDGTLLLNGPVARDAFAAAFEEVTGTLAQHERVSFAGMTDRGIFRALLHAADHRLDGNGFEQRFADFTARFTARLAEAYPTAPGPRLLHGAQAVVETLAERADAVLALGTGNIRATATIKLRRFGLDGYFRAGGFGGDHEDRSDVVRAAMHSARELLRWSGAASDAWVIGDTLQDVVAARAAGARVLAVGSGFTPLAELQQSGADAVLADLGDTAGVVELLTRD